MSIDGLNRFSGERRHHVNRLVTGSGEPAPSEPNDLFRQYIGGVVVLNKYERGHIR